MTRRFFLLVVLACTVIGLWNGTYWPVQLMASGCLLAGYFIRDMALWTPKEDPS